MYNILNVDVKGKISHYAYNKFVTLTFKHSFINYFPQTTFGGPIVAHVKYQI